MANIRNVRKHTFAFFSATKLLSGRKYPTLSLNLYVYRNLKYFLTNNLIKVPKSKENFIKEHLLDVLTYHFDTKISSDQMTISLVSKLLAVKKFRFIITIIFF